MKAPSIRAVRCAIYTRVSTEYGLDQEFNSLDAQYDASSAYIKSQAHAGWTLIRSRYDDGGYSGGSTDRPDLQRLLDDIRSRKLDGGGERCNARLLSSSFRRPIATHRCEASGVR
jgi:site-specific DNA recombinase